MKEYQSALPYQYPKTQEKYTSPGKTVLPGIMKSFLREIYEKTLMVIQHLLFEVRQRLISSTYRHSDFAKMESIMEVA
jgi:hypothetical protein